MTLRTTLTVFGLRITYKNWVLLLDPDRGLRLSDLQDVVSRGFPRLRSESFRSRNQAIFLAIRHDAPFLQFGVGSAFS